MEVIIIHRSNRTQSHFCHGCGNRRFVKSTHLLIKEDSLVIKRWYWLCSRCCDQIKACILLPNFNGMNFEKACDVL